MEVREGEFERFGGYEDRAWGGWTGMLGHDKKHCAVGQEGGFRCAGSMQLFNEQTWNLSCLKKR